MKKEISKKINFLIIPFFITGLFFYPGKILARENATDWYIQDFETEIVANKNSSLDITENITADCGNASGKHGIFRILPEKIRITDGSEIGTPVELLGITDFSGKKINYTESRNSSDNTVTWKIGDADKTVTGVNYYKIHYTVKNAIRFSNPDFDEFYWNLNGNFWDLETDNFHAKIIFPEEVDKEKSQVEYYAGPIGSKDKSLATYKWTAANVLEFNSVRTLPDKNGITASVTFPKNVFTPYKPGFWEAYGIFFSLLLPLIVFIICFRLWLKYGKDSHLDKTVIAEYGVPGNLMPMEMGMLMKNSVFDNSFITAEIINLAVMQLITIKEIHEKVLLFDSTDYLLTKNPNEEKEKNLLVPQKIILDKIFESGNEIKLSSLKYKLHEVVNSVKEKTNNILEEKKLIGSVGHKMKTTMIAVAAIVFFASFFVAAVFPSLFMALIISALIIFIFALPMAKRTPEGTELNWQIKGFELFMETVDKDRAAFYEKENIFEKFLPYAIIFGMTKIWIKKMQEIYGEQYFATHAPMWFTGRDMGAFNADSFNSAISGLSSSIAASTSSPSGSGGSGSSGGGGGGGGGGGW